MTDAAHRFADTWREHWISENADALLALYSPAIVHRSRPFRAPHRGLDELGAYFRSTFAEEHAVAVEFSEPLVDGDRAVFEFWVRFSTGATLSGTVFARFDAGGLVTESRDYWHEAAQPQDNPGFFTRSATRTPS